MSSAPLQLQKFQIDDWLASLDFPALDGKKFHRKFSDGTLLAELLSKLYPKLVNLKNYPSKLSYASKLNNLETLNMKVLRKLNLAQSDKVLQSIARAEPGAIERLLHQIMRKDKENEISSNSEETNESKDSVNNEESNVTIKENEKLSKLYEKAKAELQQNFITIGNLNKRNKFLEIQVKEKDKKNKDLLKLLDGNLSTDGLTKEIHEIGKEKGDVLIGK